MDTLRHSYIDLEDPTHLEFSYTQAIATLLDTTKPKTTPLTALHLGAGGLTIPRYLAHTRPGTQSLVAEIDPGVIDIAETQLGFTNNTNGITTTIGDARTITTNQPRDTYTTIIGDAFDAGTVPLHLLTSQFLEQVSRTLTPDGVYVLNLIDAPPLTLLRSALATVRGAFGHTIVAARPGNLAGALRGNFVIAGCDAAFPIQAVRQRLAQCDPPQDLLYDPVRLDTFIGDAPVLTDEFVTLQGAADTP